MIIQPTVEDRDYQLALEQQTYDGWNCGQKNMLNVLATGGGKSIIMSNITLKGAQANLMQCVIAHRNELVGQMSAHIGRREIAHRIVGSDATINQIRRQHRALFNGQQFVHPTARTSVVGVDTLIARKDVLKDWAYQHDRWMIDECFPAGTRITTARGQEAIESLRIGDEVLAFDDIGQRFEYKKIARLFKNPIPHNMVRLTTSTHHVIETTHGHPFWTQRGWVEAANLRNNDDVLLLRMRGGNKNDNGESALSLAQNRQDLLPEKVQLQNPPETILEEGQTSSKGQNLSSVSDRPQSPECENMLQDMSRGNSITDNGTNKQKIRIESHEEKQSNAFGRNTTENVRNSEKNKAQTASRRQREGNTSSGAEVDRLPESVRIHSSVCDQNRDEAKFGLSDILQTGYGITTSEDCNRSGREQSQRDDAQGIGSQERFNAGFVRLASIEVFQPRNNGESEQDYVYNIEVDDLHTYVANEIVVHNCHHVLRTNKWGKATQMMPNALGSGFTATPIRADGQGLGREYDGVFDVMNIGPSMRELINRGFLCDYEIVCPTSDLQVGSEELSANGDWSTQTLKKAAKKSRIVGDVVENYCKYAMGRRAIVFATDIETAGDIAKKFNEWGIRAAALSAETPMPVREKYIGEFKSGRLSVLINVDLFDEGFDVPACDVVIQARPTASLGKYRQMIGRALRFVAGKVALIIDMVSNWLRHGLPDKNTVWTLARRDKRGKQEKDPDEIPLTDCKNIECRKPYYRFMVACPHCGMVKPLPEPRSRTVDMVEGDLILLDRAMLEKMRQGTALESPGSIAERVALAAGAYAGMAAAKRQTEKIEAHGHLRETIAQWAGIERSRGFSDREIEKKLWLVTGMDVLTILDASRPRSEMDSLNQTIQGWWRK